MPVNITQVLERAKAAEAKSEPYEKLHRIVCETIAALGLAVNQNTGDVYDPSEGVPRARAIPEQRNVRYAGMRTRHGRR
jgi:hypothetical protein